MHELSICQELISQVEEITSKHQVVSIIKIRLQVGPLSGVEIPLLKRAYPVAAAGSIAEHASLELETMPILIRCRNCKAETEATINNLLCRKCGDNQTELVSGDEMLLSSIEFDKALH